MPMLCKKSTKNIHKKKSSVKKDTMHEKKKSSVKKDIMHEKKKPLTKKIVIQKRRKATVKTLKQRGGLRKYISLECEKIKLTDGYHSPLDIFIDNVFRLLKSSPKLFLDFKGYKIEISSRSNKLIIGLHDSNLQEYLHLTCFKSKDIRSYAHITFIDINADKNPHVYYNNDNVNSLLDLILICQEIYNAIFIDKINPLIPKYIRKREDWENWKHQWQIYLYDFIDCLEYIDKEYKIFPRSSVNKPSAKLGVMPSRLHYTTFNRTLSSNTYNKSHHLTKF